MVLLTGLLFLLFRFLPGSSVVVPGMLGLMVFAAGLLAFGLLFLVALFLGWRASAGDMFRLPLAGEWAEEKMIAASGLTRDDFLATLPEAHSEPEPEPYPFASPDDPIPETVAWEGFGAQKQSSVFDTDPGPPPPRPSSTLPTAPADPAAVRAFRARGERFANDDKGNVLRQWLSSVEDD